jgi:GNAT superfamily N-acetyltransferase
VPPSPGFSTHHVASDDDIERRVYVQTTSFEHSTSTVDVWRALRRLPAYSPTLDLVTVGPDGGGASACTCWYDEANRCGEFEPVGTSKAYQRMGLGKITIIEGLRRLRARGATQAIVQTNITNVSAIALYRSCGFEVVAEDHSWTRSL